MPHIQEFMTSKMVSVEASQPISEAARLMKQHDIGLLPVTSGGSLVGVVTDRDIVIRAVAEDAGNLPVGEIVTPNPVIVSPADDAQTAVRLMSQHDVRRLPVAEQGTVVGVVSVGDLATRAGSELAGTVMKNTGPLDRPVARGEANGTSHDSSQQHSLFESAEHGATDVEHLV